MDLYDPGSVAVPPAWLPQGHAPLHQWGFDKNVLRYISVSSCMTLTFVYSRVGLFGAHFAQFMPNGQPTTHKDISKVLHRLLGHLPKQHYRPDVVLFIGTGDNWRSQNSLKLALQEMGTWVKRRYLAGGTSRMDLYAYDTGAGSWNVTVARQLDAISLRSNDADKSIKYWDLRDSATLCAAGLAYYQSSMIPGISVIVASHEAKDQGSEEEIHTQSLLIANDAVQTAPDRSYQKRLNATTRHGRSHPGDGGGPIR